MPARRGTVLRTAGGVYTVRTESGDVIEAALRGRLKLEQRTGDRIVAGDTVEIDVQADGRGTIEQVEPRRTELARRAPGHGGRRAKVIVANVDQVVIVFAAANPDPRLRMLDRFLVLAEANELPAVVVINKIELRPRAEVLAEFEPYARAGYGVLPTSAREGEGFEPLRDLLCGRTSVLTGPSGVGKSSLLNALQPGLTLRTADVSARSHKGQHTTVTAELVPLDCGGFVADTPGLRELGFWQIPVEQLDACFPEFRPYLGQCRFARCSHTHEPDCAVREAVETGDVATQRYEGYLRLRQEDTESGHQ